MTFVAELEPPALWGHFDTILTIPRGSKNEEAMRQYVISVAKANGLGYDVDGAGNLVVRKPGAPGHEDAPITILQSHLDMVNEKNSDVEHDFTKDAITPQRQGEFLTATGTTLGSDNGIGVATMLALMETSDVVHGPLEFLFTIDEETGLTGAAKLDGDLLKGRQLLNLDSEEEEILYVGCAGGGESKLSLALQSEPVPAGSAILDVRASGFKGGHSGGEIHLQRGNAIKLLARTVLAASETVPVRLATFEGGSAHNAIPREARALVVVAEGDRQGFEAAFEAEWSLIGGEYAPAEPDMRYSIADGQAAEGWSSATTEAVLRLVNGLPHGIAAMSYDIPDLVETSTNLATVVRENGALVIGLSSRSSVESALHALRRQIRSIGVLAGASVDEDEPYPGWKPNLESHLLTVVKRVHQETFGMEPEIRAIHAGLECGIIGKKIPGIDMLSFGPLIQFPHSPDERVHIDSVDRFYRLLLATLEALA